MLGLILGALSAAAKAAKTLGKDAATGVRNNIRGGGGGAQPDQGSNAVNMDYAPKDVAVPAPIAPGPERSLMPPISSIGGGLPAGPAPALPPRDYLPSQAPGGSQVHDMMDRSQAPVISTPGAVDPKKRRLGAMDAAVPQV